MILIKFQDRVYDWVKTTFGSEVADNKIERNYRFLEESLELIQACGFKKEDCYQLIDYVYSRPPGEIHQEIGGVLVTLSALCSAHMRDMESCGYLELARILSKIEEIQQKQKNKSPNIKAI